MPKKTRELKTMLSKAGFELLPGRGKGSHSYWVHPVTGQKLTIPGKDGSDAKPYIERRVMDLLAELAKREAENREEGE